MLKFLQIKQVRILFYIIITCFTFIQASANEISGEVKSKAPMFDRIDYKLIASLKKLSAENHNKSFDDKLLIFSDHFLGKPYDFNIGEKLISWDKKRNKKKLLEFSKFDCISYIEAVIALSKLDSSYANNKEFLNALSEKLSSIMFAVNDVSYTGRNHFFDSEWLNHNKMMINSNLADNVDYAKERITTIDKKSFLEQQLKNYSDKYVNEENKIKFLDKFQNNLNKFSKVESKIKYISFQDFINHKDEIISILKDKIYLFAIVMDNSKIESLTKTGHNIGHVGFAYAKNNEIYLKHASSLQKITENVNFTDYAKSKIDSDVFIGFNLYELK